jgi:hypothetical protein
MCGTKIFTLAIFGNVTKFEANTAEKKLALYCPIKIFLCNVFWIVFFGCNCSSFVGEHEHSSSS